MLRISTGKLNIRLLALEDTEVLTRFETRNANFWKNVSPLSQHQFSLNDFLKDQAEGRSFRFIVRHVENENEVIATCNYTQIFRGPFQACYLGYKIDKNYEGQGLMREALSATIDYMFTEQNLHRIMANYMPVNVRSEKLLLSLGFKKEGYAEKYLLVNGQWEDHVMTALINTNWKKQE